MVKPSQRSAPAIQAVWWRRRSSSSAHSKAWTALRWPLSCPRRRYFILLDAGANPDARAEHLVHDAIIGSHYARIELGCAEPRVGLLTIGTEEGKGNAVIAETHDALKRIGSLVNYVGPIEGFQLFADHVDVVVCDGFVGNICIKSWESLVKFFSNELRDQLQTNPCRATGAFLARGAFAALRQRINPERYGGAPSWA